MAIDRTAGRLQNEDVGTTHVFLNLRICLAVAESRDQRLPARQPKKCADFVSQRLVGRAAEDLELIVHASAYGLALRLVVGAHLSLLFGLLSRCRKSSHKSR